jgi:hypothetical protein
MTFAWACCGTHKLYKSHTCVSRRHTAQVPLRRAETASETWLYARHAVILRRARGSRCWVLVWSFLSTSSFLGVYHELWRRITCKTNRLENQHNETNVMHFSFNSLGINGPLHVSSITCSSSGGVTQTAFGIIDQNYTLIITPSFDTQTPTCFGIHVPSSGSFLCPYAETCRSLRIE